MIFFITIASLSIGLYEPTEADIERDEQTKEGKYIPPEVADLDEKVKQTIVNWLYLTAVLLFVTAIAGMANTILMSMSERKREIGILRSIGLRRREIVEIFFAESFMICVIALAIGTILGLHLSNNIFNYLKFEGSGNVFFATMRTPPVVLFATVVIVFVVGVFAAIVPAYRAAKLSPVDALRS